MLGCGDGAAAGRVVGSVPRADATEEMLVSMIIGEKTADARTYERKPIAAETKPVLEVRDLKAKDDRDRLALDDISLNIKPGEILGVAGVSGNGQKELGEVIQGVRPALSGSIMLGRQRNPARQHRAKSGRRAWPACRKTRSSTARFRRCRSRKISR